MRRTITHPLAGVFLIVAALLLAVGDFGDGVFDWWALTLTLLLVGLALDHRARRPERKLKAELDRLDRLARQARR